MGAPRNFLMFLRHFAPALLVPTILVVSSSRSIGDERDAINTAASFVKSPEYKFGMDVYKTSITTGHELYPWLYGPANELWKQSQWSYQLAKPLPGQDAFEYAKDGFTVNKLYKGVDTVSKLSDFYQKPDFETGGKLAVSSGELYLALAGVSLGPVGLIIAGEKLAIGYADYKIKQLDSAPRPISNAEAHQAAQHELELRHAQLELREQIAAREAQQALLDQQRLDQAMQGQLNAYREALTSDPTDLVTAADLLNGSTAAPSNSNPNSQGLPGPVRADNAQPTGGAGAQEDSQEWRPPPAVFRRHFNIWNDGNFGGLSPSDGGGFDYPVGDPGHRRDFGWSDIWRGGGLPPLMNSALTGVTLNHGAGGNSPGSSPGVGSGPPSTRYTPPTLNTNGGCFGFGPSECQGGVLIGGFGAPQSASGKPVGGSAENLKAGSGLGFDTAAPLSARPKTNALIGSNAGGQGTGSGTWRVGTLVDSGGSAPDHTRGPGRPLVPIAKITPPEKPIVNGPTPAIETPRHHQAVHTPSVDVPKTKAIIRAPSVSALQTHTPTLHTPSIKTPPAHIPRVHTPTIIVRTPTPHGPTVRTPTVRVPTVRVPTVRTPTVHVTVPTIRVPSIR